MDLTLKRLGDFQVADEVGGHNRQPGCLDKIEPDRPGAL